MFSPSLNEAQLIKEVADKYFKHLDKTTNWTVQEGSAKGKIDFAIKKTRTQPSPGNSLFHYPTEYLIWAEAKRGTTHDIYKSFVQLILTIGRNKLYNECMPTKFIDANNKKCYLCSVITTTICTKPLQ